MESTDTAKTVTLDKIKDEVQYQRVNVDVKVMEIGDITVLDDGRRVQNVADATGTAELALWLGKLIVDKSYKLKNVMVKSFGNTCSLFTPK